jgi:hypothetical protein
MKAMRQLGSLVVAILLVAAARGQAVGVSPTPDVASADPNRWSFAFAAFGYLVPQDQSYFSPTFRADHKWLHVEARYNYENQQTGSLWAGYNFSFGDKLAFEATPMLGGVFGSTSGIAPGYEASLTYKRLALSSEGEYVFDTTNDTQSFFYSWNELTYAPTDWFHAGLVSQRSRAYHTPLDVQRGLSAGFSYQRVDFTTYVFNAGWTDPTVVLAVGFKF